MTTQLHKPDMRTGGSERSLLIGMDKSAASNSVKKNARDTAIKFIFEGLHMEQLIWHEKKFCDIKKLRI